MQFNKTDKTIDDFDYISERVEPVPVKANIAPLNEPPITKDGHVIATSWQENMVVVEFEDYGWPNHLYGDKRYMFIELSRLEEK